MILAPNSLPSSLASLALISCFVVTSAVFSQEPKRAETNPSNLGPVVDEWHPKTGSINSVIELSGYRLYPEDSDRAKAFFIQNGVEFPARTGGGSSMVNDADHGPQTLDVIVPEEVVPGKSEIVLEVDGRRTVPRAVTITEWQLPVITLITPTRGAPGTSVHIECDGFHINDEIELTDAEGKTIRYESGGSSMGTSFDVPKDAPEGVLNIRIGNTKRGKGQFTEPVTFVVTNDLLPPELSTLYMNRVAPGQWLYLLLSHGSLKHSERTEVAFKQAGREIVVALAKPSRPHVGVPSALSPGAVELQVRIWRGGQPSEWSRPVIFALAEEPLAPSVNAIRLKEGSWVQLWPGPDRAQSFTVRPGDEVVLNGTWPVADVTKLRVLLVRPGEVVTLTVRELDEKADLFGDLIVRLPKSLEEGECRMILRSETDGTHDEVPIVIRVVPETRLR